MRVLTDEDRAMAKRLIMCSATTKKHRRVKERGRKTASFTNYHKLSLTHTHNSLISETHSYLTQCPIHLSHHLPLALSNQGYMDHRVIINGTLEHRESEKWTLTLQGKIQFQFIVYNKITIIYWVVISGIIHCSQNCSACKAKLWIGDKVFWGNRKVMRGGREVNHETYLSVPCHYRSLNSGNL